MEEMVENEEAEPTSKAPNKLVVCTMKGLVDSYLVGVSCRHGHEEITMQYASLVTLQENSTSIQVTPAIMPLGLIGDSFGKEAITAISAADSLTTTYIDLVKDSPHKFIRQFVEFWGEEVFN